MILYFKKNKIYSLLKSLVLLKVIINFMFNFNLIIYNHLKKTIILKNTILIKFKTWVRM